MALCHTGIPEKREADSLGQRKMGVGWVRFVLSLYSFLCGLTSFVLNMRKREK